MPRNLREFIEQLSNLPNEDLLEYAETPQRWDEQELDRIKREFHRRGIKFPVAA